MKYGTHPEQTMRSGPLFDRVPVRSDLSHSLRNSDPVDCPKSRRKLKNTQKLVLSNSSALNLDLKSDF